MYASKRVSNVFHVLFTRRTSNQAAQVRCCACAQVEYHVVEVNGTYWKDPSFPNDPDNWVYAPTACPCCYFPPAATSLWASCTAQAEHYVT